MSPNDTNQYDSVLVANIDIGCSDISNDVVKVSNVVVDDQGNRSSEIYDKQEQWDHSQFFRVKFDGKPYDIEPGKTKLLPRFVAEHFAKHLADHVLQKKEEATKRQGLVQSSVERPKVLKEILTEMNEEVTERVVQSQTEVPDNIPTEDLGVVPNYAVGNLKPEPLSLEELLKEAGEDPEKVDRIAIDETSLVDDKKPLPTRKQLFELCYQQSIDVKPTGNKATLIEKLKKG